MPGSVEENRGFVQEVVNGIIKPAKILDVGAGSGTYGKLLAGIGVIDAVEIWAPYIGEFKLETIYDRVFERDAREFEDFDYNLVIFGDVLEHMSLEDAKSVWERAGRQADWGMISVPIIHYPQGPEFGNPHEEHVQDHLTVDDVIEHFGPFDFYKQWAITATFFRRFR